MLHVLSRPDVIPPYHPCNLQPTRGATPLTATGASPAHSARSRSRTLTPAAASWFSSCALVRALACRRFPGCSTVRLRQVYFTPRRPLHHFVSIRPRGRFALTRARTLRLPAPSFTFHYSGEAELHMRVGGTSHSPFRRSTPSASGVMACIGGSWHGSHRYGSAYSALARAGASRCTGGSTQTGMWTRTYYGSPFVVHCSGPEFRAGTDGSSAF
ncbi:hypothetical protein B0H13DRAFT_2318713 [Mycena leptocephala]|nr:hypothetical protein B0H13DRAFT_2318713 [Mycena leptocephala]